MIASLPFTAEFHGKIIPENRPAFGRVVGLSIVVIFSTHSGQRLRFCATVYMCDDICVGHRQ